MMWVAFLGGMLGGIAGSSVVLLYWHTRTQRVLATHEPPKRSHVDRLSLRFSSPLASHVPAQQCLSREEYKKWRDDGVWFSPKGMDEKEAQRVTDILRSGKRTDVQEVIKHVKDNHPQAWKYFSQCDNWLAMPEHTVQEMIVAGAIFPQHDARFIPIVFRAVDYSGQLNTTTFRLFKDHGADINAEDIQGNNLIGKILRYDDLFAEHPTPPLNWESTVRDLLEMGVLLNVKDEDFFQEAINILQNIPIKTHLHQWLTAQQHRRALAHALCADTKNNEGVLAPPRKM